MGDKKWDLKEASEILVTLSEELSIIVPAKDNNPATYIDVPLNSILGVSFDELATESQQPTYGLVMQLMGGLATNCILNATEYDARYVALAFASEKDVNTLQRLLMPMYPRTDGLLSFSQSGAIDVSEPMLSDDELGAHDPALSNNQILMRTASLASAMIPHRHAESTINPSMLESVQKSQRAFAEHREESSSSMAAHDEAPQKDLYNLEMAEVVDVSQFDISVKQADEGIDVSQKDDLSRTQIQHQDIQARAPNNASPNARAWDSQALGYGTHEPMSHFDWNSLTERSSSLRWYPGANARQNAQKPRVQLPHQAVSSVQPADNRTRPEGQHEEHDDLYDASPKVSDGRRRSPRIIARDNIPQNLEQPLTSTAPQARVKTGPSNKLSRQLRNADGVVESNPEQIAGYNLAISTSNGASSVKTNANSKKSKAPAPAKTRILRKESTKPNKERAKSKGKAVTTEESPNASDDFDLPPSPTRIESTVQTSGNKKKATTTRQNATKAPRNNQKQAKSMPTKAATTSSSKSLAKKLKNALKNKAEANGSIQDSIHDGPSGKEVENDDDVIWDVDQAHSKEEPQVLRQSRQLANATKKQVVRAPKTEKSKVKFQLPSDKAKANQTSKAQTQGPIPRTMKAKPAPAAMSQPRSRRTAAIEADKNFQGLDDSDEIVDDEEYVPAPMHSKRHASSDAAKAPKMQEIKDGRDGSDDRPTFRIKLPIAKSLSNDSIPNSVSPDSSEKQRPDLVSDPQAGNSPEKVNLVGSASVEALEAAPGDTGGTLVKGSSTSAVETSMMPLHSGNDDESIQPDFSSVDQYVGVSEPRMNLVPCSAPQPYESITESERAHTRPQRDDLDATKLAGPRDQGHAEHNLPDIDDVSHELISKADRIEEELAPSQAPAATTVDKVRGRRTSPRLAEKAQRSVAESTAARRDPFGAKLNALMPKQKEMNPKIKSRGFLEDANVGSIKPNTQKLAELPISSKEPIAREFDEAEALTFKKAKQVEKPRRHLNSAMQVDGEGGSSPTQTLKPAGESKSGTGVETKRKIEQVGSTSHKRVKLAPQERLEVSARRRPAHDSEKTPPPVVSNKPLVIGFSSTGPKNQGTVSTKKSNPPKDIGTAASSAEESRKHGIPNYMTNQVEAGFASVQQALEPRKLIQHDPKTAGGARKEARVSPQRKRAEHLKIVNAVAIRHANTPSQKRKFAPFLDEPAPWEQEQLSKRHKRDMETPPTAHNHHPKMLPDLSPAVIYDRSQQFSSQNTRVNENGSPMPFLIPHNEYIADGDQYSDEDDGKDALAKARLEEQIVLQEDDPILPEPSLPHRPLVPALLISQSKITAYQSLSNNSKQVPSSPQAPSAFGTLPPHHIYHDGEIVNAETKESIIPSIPQDPFLGATQNLQNPFMDALRKSTEVAAKRLVAGANEKKGSGGAVMRPSFIVGEDPDKTLVEPKVRRKYKQVFVVDSSSSSQSGSSTQESQPDESSEEESDAETRAKWRKALEPHQENMLECLLTISHVSKV